MFDWLDLRRLIALALVAFAVALTLTALLLAQQPGGWSHVVWSWSWAWAPPGRVLLAYSLMAFSLVLMLLVARETHRVASRSALWRQRQAR